jgi:hypothetical protein
MDVGTPKKRRKRIKVRETLRRFYWNSVVMRLNRLAYLHHIVDSCSPDDMYEVEQEIEEILTIETQIWLKRANGVHVAVSDIPLPEGVKSYWIEGRYGYAQSHLDWDTLRKFKALVEEKEYERKKRKHDEREIWFKWFTAIAATIAALASLLTLYFSHWKEPK